jgi:hypothetical protein
MADLEFEDFEGGYGAPGSPVRLNRTKQLVNIAGAVCSVGLLAGMGVWGYQLAVRDVSGVPVMRALAGPMRLAPVDPGGDQASHQGLSVNAVAATGSSAPVADQLTLAPRAVELLLGDTSGLNAPAQAEAAPTDLVPVNLSISGQASPGTPRVAEAPPLEDGAGSLIDTETGRPVELVSADAELPPGDGVTRSLRPQARPSALTAKQTPLETGEAAPAVVTSVETVSAPPPVTELDANSLEVGTRLAQLGAFDTPDMARAKYQELQVVFAELMAGKAMVIQSAQSGGRTFYRLRAHGFPGDDEARRFCAALQAQNTDCIPVAQR